jgi:hypothetical protein
MVRLPNKPQGNLNALRAWDVLAPTAYPLLTRPTFPAERSPRAGA